MPLALQTHRIDARRTAVLGLLAALLLALVPTVPAAAQQGTTVPYLALGDSLPYGWDTVTQPEWSSPATHVGYPEVLAARSPLVVTNASCPGETSGSFLDRDTADNGCGRVASGIGLKADWRTGSQLDFAVDFLRANPDTGLVTLQLGANDLFLCQDGPGGCSQAEFGAVLGTTAVNTSTALGTMRATGYDGPIVLVSYYALDYADPMQTAIAAASHSVMQQVASSFTNVHVADGFAAFEQATRRADGDPWAAELLLVGDDGELDVHTTPRGDRVLAQAVRRAVDLGGIVSKDRSGR